MAGAIRRTVSALLLVALLLLSCACMMPKRDYSYTIYGAFDTVTNLTSYSSESESLRLVERLEALLWEYHRLYDIYTDYIGINNIKTVNDMAGIAPVEVDERIIDLLAYGQEIDALTSGACRITYGAVLSIWHEYRAAGAVIPSSSLLAEAQKHTDPSLLTVDREAGTVYLSDPDASLDVGAIAKGFATERICEILLDEGYSDFALNVGGNLRVVGKQKGVDGWTLGIRDPRVESGVLTSVTVTDAALVTSGIYERYYTVNGKHLHHLIDPDTAMPAEGWLSITVLCSDSALADALTTALFMMSYEEGNALITSIGGVDALWVDVSGDVYATMGIRLPEPQQ